MLRVSEQGASHVVGIEKIGGFVAVVNRENKTAIHAARRANMDVSVAGQPEAATLQAGSLVRFTGTLASYDRTPLMLHWQKARINPQDIPPTKK